MKKLAWLFLLFLNSVCLISQTNFSRVTFLVLTNSVREDESLFITGNDSLLGYWNPSAVQLDMINDSTWSQNFYFENNALLEFKFTKGSWTTEALNSDGSIPANHTLTVTHDTTLICYIQKWRDKQKQVIHGQVTGNIKYHLNFQGEGLMPRDIAVWLPPSYFDKLEKHYPVLYMHDGQNIFDASTSSFGNEWRLDETTDSLIKKNQIEEIIIVAVYNTVDRSGEYSHTPLGYCYMNFLVTQLKPFIDLTYRTLSQAEFNAVGGASLGGLISFMLVWNYPEVFSKAACFSSAFKIDDLNYVDTVLNYSGLGKNVKLYIDIGGGKLDVQLRPGNEEIVTALLHQGFKLDKDLLYYVDENAAHSEKSWAERVWRPLVFFFGK